MIYPITFIKGQSGSGKSTSIRNLDETRTVVINLEDNALPFPKKMMSTKVSNQEVKTFTRDFHKILDKVIANDDIKYIVIDSFTSFCERLFLQCDYVYSDYDVWSNYNLEITNLLLKLKKVEDKFVFVIGIDQIIENSSGIEQNVIKVQGKVWSGSVGKEFVSVLLAEARETEEGMEHVFVTNKIKGYTKHDIKSPMELFDETIPNDLNYVVKKYADYYDIKLPEPIAKKASKKKDEPAKTEE
jgi:hypothetical protein